MNTQIILKVNASKKSISEGFAHAMDCAATQSQQLDRVKDAYIKMVGENYDGLQFAAFFAELLANWTSSRRAAMIETHGFHSSWNGYGEYQKAIQSGITAGIAWVSRQNSHTITFNVPGGRLKPADFVTDPDAILPKVKAKYPVPAFGTPIIEAKTAKQKTAEAKKNDAPEVSPAEQVAGESTTEKFNGQKLAASLSEKEARSALLNILNQFPELTMDKAVKDNFARNFEKANKCKAAEKALTKKAA